MKNKMILITVFLIFCFAVSFPIFVATKNGIAETITITVGITLYHFAIRLAVGTIVDLIMKNQADHQNAWFREKSFENKLYKLLRVRVWKKHIPTYSPDTFDINQNTVKEIIGATCQAEIIHEIIMLFSLLPIAVIPFFGGAAAIVITSVLAMMLDSVFVILQRYNRPKLVRVMVRFEKYR